MPRAFKNWLEGYIAFTQAQEAPFEFHLWCGLSTLASAIGRSQWIDRGAYILYPNMYVILVADSAWCRKSVAIDFSKRFIQKLGVNIYANKLTSEALTKRASEEAARTGRSEVTLILRELASFMTRREAEAGLAVNLIDLYDSPDSWTYDTKTQGTAELKNVCVNLLAGSTPDLLNKSFPAGAAGTGLFSRILFSHSSDGAKANPRPMLNAQMEEDLLSDLGEIRLVQGEVILDVKAEEFFSSWYIDLRKRDPASMIEGFLGRFHDHVLKLALLLVTAEGSTMTITKTHLKTAVRLLETLVKTNRLDQLGGDESQRVAKLRDQISTQKLCGHSELLKRNHYHMNAEEFKQAIDVLVDTGEIEMELNGKKIHYVWKG